MFRSLLVPLDGSPFGAHALPAAVAIARRSGAALHLVRVHLPMGYVPFHAADVPELTSWNQQVRAEECAYLESIAERIRQELDISTSYAVVEQPVADAIRRHAEEVSADLIVMTTHGRTGLSRAWLGSVADALIRHATTPALLVRPGKQPPDIHRERVFNHLLIALDGSGFAQQVLRPAAALAKVEGARCTLLHVVVPSMKPVPPYPQAPRATAVDQEAVDAHVAQAERSLAELAESLRHDGIDVEVEARVHERPARAILNRARSDEIDCIAMAVHGRGPSRLLLGSVADKVLRGSALPMLLTRPGE